MNENKGEPIIRLIVDGSAETIGDAVGLSKQKQHEVAETVEQWFQQYDKVSRTMKEITSTYTHDAELTYALFHLGYIYKMSTCPLHQPGGMLGLLGGNPDEDIRL